MARKAWMMVLLTLVLILVWPPSVTSSSSSSNSHIQRTSTNQGEAGEAGLSPLLYQLFTIRLSDSDVAGIRDWLCRIDANSSNKYLRRHRYAPRKCLKHHPCPPAAAANSTASNTAFVETCVAALFDTPSYLWLDRMKRKHLDCHHYFMSLSKMIKLYRNRGMCMARGDFQLESYLRALQKVPLQNQLALCPLHSATLFLRYYYLPCPDDLPRSPHPLPVSHLDSEFFHY
ncbi:OLC1v1007594C1 [Oldenlandia corymbosa var. corymbosa]|uniref:OLC1v1007594C1 n=1 Tax=Oldenlandia corymbosa var. corymbosa TaxID=529605 RepID=A0AAV1DM20_OLDCO|nr:OLC1v1007594C1 [Oldenlandia corymbosa var. corymbosa]